MTRNVESLKKATLTDKIFSQIRCSEWSLFESNPFRKTEPYLTYLDPYLRKWTVFDRFGP